MSSHGPPGGPYGGYPGQSGESSEPPSDPWLAYEDPWRDDDQTSPQLVDPQLTGLAPAAWDPAGRQQPPVGQPPGPAPPRGANVLLFVAVGLLVLVVAAGVGYALYLLSGEQASPGDDRTPAPEGVPSPGGPSAAEPSGPGQDNIGLNAAMAAVGDCMVDLQEHDDSREVQMQIVRCEPDDELTVYQVLAKLDEKIEGADEQERNDAAEAVCQGTEGYTHHYYRSGESLNFVLCMAVPEDLGES